MKNVPPVTIMQYIILNVRQYLVSIKYNDHLLSVILGTDADLGTFVQKILLSLAGYSLQLVKLFLYLAGFTIQLVTLCCL